MRALVLVALIACGSKDNASPASPKPVATTVRVDRRVELVSFVCALAGFKEYTLGQSNAYRSAFVRAFAPYVAHPAVQMAKQLRADKGIGYDAPMILAVHLDDNLQLVNAQELPLIDKRWAGVDAEAYAAKLRAFAADTKLDEFLATATPPAKLVEDALRTAVDAEHPVDWYDALLGARSNTRFTVVPGRMTGTYNFSVRATLADGKVDLYQVIAVDTPTGLPQIDETLVYLLVHELGHSYINHVLAQHEAELAAPAQKLFVRVAGQMGKQAYGSWQIFLGEQVVRAAVVVYLGDKKGAAAAAAAIERERALGFLWTAEVADLLRTKRADYVAHLPALLAQLAQR